MKTFKALSLLLSYPSEELQQAIPQIDALLHAEGLLGPKRMETLAPLLRDLARGDLYDLQERYVLLFDRSRTLSLNLFEHIHGESRDRGGAMVDLLDMYRAGGFDLGGTELPDHLPVLLEYLSTRPLAEAQEDMADTARVTVRMLSCGVETARAKVISRSGAAPSRRMARARPKPAGRAAERGL